MGKKTEIDEKYTVQEILNAVNDFQEISRDKVETKKNIITKKEDLGIPTNTLKLIEEAEKNIK
tara:strand:+ start:1915 stop:2103 length:189 start_codon:yes stop_codon:yes gene_type:complete